MIVGVEGWWLVFVETGDLKVYHKMLSDMSIVVIYIYIYIIYIYFSFFLFFFFKQKTAYEFVSRDWSSDVCSSDLLCIGGLLGWWPYDQWPFGSGLMTRIPGASRSQARIKKESDAIDDDLFTSKTLQANRHRSEHDS